MTEPQPSQMDADFPHWYRTVSIGDDRERLAQRWAGLSGLVKTATPSVIEAMLRVVFRTKSPPDPTALASVNQAFKAADELSDGRVNGREVEVLCGATIAVLCRSSLGAASAAALGTLCAGVQGAREPASGFDLVGEARNGLARLAETARSRQDLKRHAAIATAKLDFEKATAKVQEVPNWDGVGQAFGLAAEATRAALVAVSRRFSEVIADAERFIGVQDEELQMLWWLVGGRSWDLNCNFERVPARAQPLVFSKELAGLSLVPARPNATLALLARAGLRDDESSTIPTGVNACEKEWLMPLVEGVAPSPVTLPIHLAIQRRLETGDDTSWVAGWAGVTGLDPDRQLSRLLVGEQFFRERLFRAASGN